MAQTRIPFLDRFLRLESAGGLLLMISAALALIVANSPLVGTYNLLLDTPVEIQVGGLEVAKPLLLWINDGLMAVFFFLIGLELKRELVEGELADKRNIVLPGLGAIGGMAIPALVYLAFNRGDALAQQGWAIPAATDIAFALGILSLLGSRVPTTVKIFLTSLAIFDDIGAILIIAMFYTSKISLVALAVVAGCIAVLALMSRLKIEARSLFIFVGIVMWTAMLKSGVHATLAGVVLAMFIPMRSKHDPEYSPLKSLEHDLHSVVAFVILPVFAFANAGISFAGLEAAQVLHGVSIGVALGLFVGKQVGVFAFCALGIRAGVASLPAGMNWGALYGTAAMTGVGFTMSLFIGSLAFEGAGLDRLFDERIGIIAGSLASGLLGYLILRRVYGGSKG
ncbi:MAG: Na+/H+ antiporter NhaA [Candidatus Krumholzibacteria bacterium]|nr:Na+/H+ antiporter NhaA [Candidatus Krumholzibacteria bacterium]